MAVVDSRGEQVAGVPVVSGGGREVMCSAPGCGRMFVKRSGRHIYCKGPGCTYKRGAHPEPEPVTPEGAAAEVLRRLQDAEHPEPGPSLFAEAVKAVAPAIRARDALAAAGALNDVAKVSIWWSDQVAQAGIPAVQAQAEDRRGSAQVPRAVGLVHSTMAALQRTLVLAERRVEAIWAMLRARELLQSAELAMEQQRGTPGELIALEARDQAKASYDAAERALQSLEAAWQERRQAVGELAAGAQSLTGAALANANGGNGARGQSAAAV